MELKKRWKQYFNPVIVKSLCHPFLYPEPVNTLKYHSYENTEWYQHQIPQNIDSKRLLLQPEQTKIQTFPDRIIYIIVYYFTIHYFTLSFKNWPK